MPTSGVGPIQSNLEGDKPYPKQDQKRAMLNSPGLLTRSLEDFGNEVPRRMKVAPQGEQDPA